MRAGPTVFNYRSELCIIPLPTDWLTDSSTFLLIPGFLSLSLSPPLHLPISLPWFRLILGRRIRHWREFLSFPFPFRQVRRKKERKKKHIIWHLKDREKEEVREWINAHNKFLYNLWPAAQKQNKVSYTGCVTVFASVEYDFLLPHYKRMGISTAEWAERYS